jgi:hypothetical protein
VAIAIRGSTPLVVATTANPISGTLTGARQPQSGDLLVIIHGNDYYALSNMPTPTVGGSTSGVNAITSGSADGGSLFAHAKSYTYAVGSTGDLTVSVTETGAGDEEKCLIVYVLSGADTATPTDGANNNVDSSGTTTNRVCNAVSPSSADAYLIVHTNDGNGSNSVSYLPPSGMSEQYDGSLGGAMGYSGATLQLSSSGSTGTKTFTASGNASYCSLTIAVKTAAAATSIPFNPQRSVLVRDSGEVQWLQRDRRDANLVATAANDLAAPLTVAEHARSVYGYSAYRDRRSAPQQRTYTDLSLLAPAAAMPAPPAPRTPTVRDYGEAQWQQPARRDPLLLTTALLENELLGGAETGKRTSVPATHADRREVPQQRAYFDLSPLATALLETPLVWARPQPAISDRREVPAQRAYISDPSFYPTVAPADPLTLAWGAGGPYWHLYNDVRVERRVMPQQRAYVSPAGLLDTALLDELLGVGDTARHYLAAATHTSRRLAPQQRQYFDLGLLLTALLEIPYVRPQQPSADRRTAAAQPRWPDPNLLAPPVPDIPPTDPRRFLPATHADRRQVPAQPARLTLYFDAGPGSPPLTLAWGAGGNLWHRYNPRWPARWWPVAVIHADTTAVAPVPGTFTSHSTTSGSAGSGSSANRARSAGATSGARNSTASLDARSSPST